MTRLLDIGLDRVRSLIIDMSGLSLKSVLTAVDAYQRGVNAKREIYDWSENLRILQEEVSELVIELIARYQPVATDLRFIRSCLEISYDLSRFGRYAYDIADLLDTMGPLLHCDKTPVLTMAESVRTMIAMSIKAFENRDSGVVKELYRLDDIVDTHYRNYLKFVIDKSNMDNQETKCVLSVLLIMRYLERISDHACYIGDSVHYVATGNSSSEGQ